MTEMFKKARAASDHMRTIGYFVEITTHPTGYGNSAYVTASLSKDRVSITRGFRLSDHEVGERRKAQDDFLTIIDGSDVTVDALIKLLTIDTCKLDELAVQAAAKREKLAEEEAEEEARMVAEKEGRRAEEAAHIERLNDWLGENCPEYGNLNKSDKKKARKRANAALYPQTQTPPFRV